MGSIVAANPEDVKVDVVRRSVDEICSGGIMRNAFDAVTYDGTIKIARMRTYHWGARG